jgi:methionyl aminopeptidase
MREACRLTAEVRDLCASKIGPGMTTKDIHDIVLDFCRRNKVTASFLGYMGYPGALCVSINDEVIHGIPSEHRIIMPGDLVKIDVGICKNGFNGDTACTIPIGVSDPDILRLVETTKRCLAAGIKAVRPGAHIGDIGAAVQEIAEREGFGVVRDFVGHGIGKELHEDPSVPNFGTPGRGVRLLPGMTIAVEPMINQGTWEVNQLSDGWTIVTKDGKLAAHFEHTIAITKDGECMILTLPD